MHTDFIELSAVLCNENLLKTDFLFSAHQRLWCNAFGEHFQSICTEIANQQKYANLPALSRIEYNMLYTNFINRSYIAEVWVYGDKLYTDKYQQMIGEYDLSFLFIFFDELWNKLLSTRKRYVGMVRAHEVTALIIQTLPDFYSYLVSVARHTIRDLVDKQPFISIAKNEDFRVNIGEYMSCTEPVFIEKRNKNAKVLAEYFMKQLRNAYTFEDYSNLDFSGQCFTYTELRYSHFRNTCLNDSTLEGSCLIGTSFIRASMENCCMNKCSIQEADFSYANLKNACFVNACGKAGLPDKYEWRHTGFLPVSFRNANLTNTDFTGADLTGADFTDAILDGTDFTSAVLDDTIFSDSTFVAQISKYQG